MGILFGGWWQKEEDECNEYYGGDWVAYNKTKEERKEKFKYHLPEIKTDNSVESVLPGDIIGIWNKETGQLDHQFFIDRIKEGKIYGRYISFNGDGETKAYDKLDWVKVCSTFQE